MSSDKPRILMAATARPDNKALAEALVREFAVTPAKDGADALAKGTANPPDLILLEAELPEMDGFEACRRFKEQESTQAIPVILLHSGDEQDDEKGFRLGAADAIFRPYRLPVALARIRNGVEFKRRGDLLEELAMLDGLTKLPNRNNFEKALSTEWLRGQRAQEALSLILCNIDEFRKYNDHFGHASGDECLTAAAEVLEKTASRASDIAARLGSEGFALLLPATDRDGAMTIAETIRTALESRGIAQAPSTTWPLVTMSLGVATMTPSRDTSREMLYESAGKALREAKETGRNKGVAAAPFRKLFG